MSIGAFTLIRNESPWVGYCVLAAKDLVDQWVFYDGNSTDGTVELLKYLRDEYKLNIVIREGQDPKNLQEDYVKLFNECLGEVKTKHAWFLHPDMIVTDPGKLTDSLAHTVSMRSFAGNPGGELLEIVKGRGEKWKTIMKNTLGLHYHGFYGSRDEDMYFKAITGDSHKLHADFNKYPYPISDSGIKIDHFSDVRPLERRLDRMIKCLKNQGYTNTDLAATHPRVTLSPLGGFEFAPTRTPEIFKKHAQEFATILKKPLEKICWLPVEESCLS